MFIRELIVVEGKDDIAAVKKALRAEVVATGGFRISKDLVAFLRTAVNRTGVIIFTDPDSAGNWIRRELDRLVPGCKHAYLSKEEGQKGKNVGVENASEESIIRAIQAAMPVPGRIPGNFTLQDLANYGLTGVPGADLKRKEIGKVLGIGDTNSKQFLSRLNYLGVTPEEFITAVKSIGGN